MWNTTHLSSRFLWVRSAGCPSWVPLPWGQSWDRSKGVGLCCGLSLKAPMKGELPTSITSLLSSFSHLQAGCRTVDRCWSACRPLHKVACEVAADFPERESENDREWARQEPHYLCDLTLEVASDHLRRNLFARCEPVRSATLVASGSQEHGCQEAGIIAGCLHEKLLLHVQGDSSGT